MTGRPIANEAPCPVPLETLSLLLRADTGTIERIAGALSDGQRAELAAFCYNRRHLRDLSFALALHCNERSLVRAAGTVGLVLFDQSRNPAMFEDDQPRQRSRGVSLAKSA